MVMISVVTVTLNNLDGLKRTADSVLAQSCTDCEWIVVDGASDDGTVAFLAGILGAVCISEPDDGIYDAMNKGLYRAQGDYVVFMNAGDVFHTAETLSSISQACSKYQPDFLYGDALEEGSYKTARSYKRPEWGMLTHHQAMIYNRKTVGLLRYDLQYSIAADYDFTLRVLEACQNIEYISEPLCVFEAGGVSQQSGLRGRLEQFQIRRSIKTCNIVKNMWVFGVQTLTHRLRRMAPKLYWALRRSG
jgi:putative colanic acid biosynthesis glycosyltransferase